MKELFFHKNSIYYRTNDFQSGKPTLVFVHGLSGSSSAWVEYEKKFNGKYNILSLDLRGHGKSIKFKNYRDYEIKKFAEDINELIVHLNLDKFTLISHSFGTLIALEFLAQHQNLVVSSVFLSPSFCPKKQKAANIIRPVIKFFAKLFDVFSASGKTGGHVDYSKYKNSGDWNIRRMFADIRNTSWRISLYCLGQSYDFDRESFLSKINMPVLLMHGKNDTIFPAENSVVMSEKIKNSRLILLDDTDHIIVLNNFPEVSEAIENFVK